jgi:hypothetical protein
MAASIGWPYQGLYTASKAALEGKPSTNLQLSINCNIP